MWYPVLAAFLLPWTTVVVVVSGTDTDDSPRVRVEQGLLKGRVMSARNGRPFHGYFKIPYARPPLGELRFQAPVEPGTWEGVRDATTDDGVMCIQRGIFRLDKFTITGEEDCLYLNVYTPKVDKSKSDLLPVMVFFHGGGFTCGSGNSGFYPPQYLMERDVVYVSLNYRLGPIGFLSMEDDVLPGNNGLKDQVQALRWVRRNIKHFGGNPELVTIFGESAGGASVHFHMVSPMSKGLFHRGISESGTAIGTWAIGLPGTLRNKTERLAKAMLCPTKCTKGMLECLRKKTAADIVGTDLLFMEWFLEPMIPFRPVVERSGREDQRFLPEHPDTALMKGNVAHVPWMTGVNSGEGALKVAAFYGRPYLLDELNENFDQIAPMSLFYREFVDDVQAATAAIKKFYFDNRKISLDNLVNTTNLWTDAWFLSSANNAVRLMYKNLKAPVYYYYLSYRGTLTFSTVFGDPVYEREYGVCHADELIYLFPVNISDGPVQFTELDKKYMKVLVDLWTSFAATGEPTSDLTDDKWMPVTTDAHEYLHLAPESIKMESNLLPERSEFWYAFNSRIKPYPRDEL